jgi:hypothetical protein
VHKKKHKFGTSGVVSFIIMAFLGMPLHVLAKNIQLGFSPETGIDDVDSSLAQGWKGHTVLVREMKDQRNREANRGTGDVIGASAKRNGELYVTTENLVPYCNRALMYIMNKNNISLVWENPSLYIQPVLKYLFINENDSYLGRAVILFTVMNASGEKIWENEVVDSAQYWGKTFSEETFLGALRKTLVNVTKTFMENRDLNNAMANQPRLPDAQNYMVINSPRDLGIRGKYRQAPVGPSIASCILLAGAAGLFMAGRTSDDEIAQILCIAFSVPAGVVGLTIGTISIVKWGLRANWQSQKTAIGERLNPGVQCSVTIAMKGI